MEKDLNRNYRKNINAQRKYGNLDPVTLSSSRGIIMGIVWQRSCICAFTCIDIFLSQINGIRLYALFGNLLFKKILF